ncbi:hypothetical protein [Brevibacillus migulae]|uniref:hypothetical protein n=1 Tax=Brevibacillus migulae TaxID=1644114 RepID=UPI00142FEE7B|nr:hypothetical protein [Brevibacillus migulae]
MNNHTKREPMVSGTFQLAEDTRVESLEQLSDKNEMEQKALDDESLYYARIFMED